MSEEKLTVAELMARAAKQGHNTDAPRRRRRRSIEDGGVSVAELTGSIPAVKDKPAEARHSSVPIDAPAEKPEPKPETKAEAKPDAKADAKADAKTEAKPEPQAAAKPEKKAEAKPEAKPAVKATEKAAVAPAKKVEKPVKDAETPKEDVEKQKPQAKTPSNEETMVLSIVDEKDPITLTTGAFPVVPASAAKPAETVRPAKDADAETSLKAEFAEESEPEAETFDTTQMEAVQDPDEAVEEESEGKLSVMSIILMAIVGIVVGVLVFMGFELLWERLNKWIVAVLAVAVTLGMVGIVHALRTSRDGFSMVLAGIVGAVMTFGPLAIVM